jgi:hypothetical protein
MRQAGTQLAAARRNFSFLIEKKTKFEILDFAFPEFAACSLQSSEFVRKCSFTDGYKIESPTKRKKPFQVWRRGSREKIKISKGPQLRTPEELTLNPGRLEKQSTFYVIE